LFLGQAGWADEQGEQEAFHQNQRVSNWGDNM
jgi:hypothetical protein